MNRVSVLAFVLLSLFSRFAFAQKIEVPAPLEPWRAWVLSGEQSKLCSHAAANDVQGLDACTWPSTLVLDVGEKRGSFRQSVTMRAAGFLNLPGDAKRWPQNVRVAEKPAVVIGQSGPMVKLEPGTYTVAGEFAWDALPESIAVPATTGLISLTVLGKKIETPNRSGSSLYFQKAAQAVEGDRMEFVVHRKVVDDIPLRLVTRLTVNVAGKNREVLLGKVLPDGFVPLALESSVPARIESDGHLRLQVRPGSYTIQIEARSEGPMNELSRPAPNGPWREGDEVWVFESRSDLRIVNVEGVTPVDPEQTTLLPDWKKLPSYAMRLTDHMKLTERQRGDSNPSPDRLQISRSIWIDFDGNGATTRDLISGQLSRSWRLDMASPSVIGRVSIDHKDLFITKNGLFRGVEVRQGAIKSVEADGRLNSVRGDIPAVGWNHDFEHVDTTLHLPPGWELLHAVGVDSVSKSWVKSFRLLEIFLVLVISLAAFRLFGATWGVIALLTLALTLTRSGAPQWLWLVLLVLEAVSRFFKSGRLFTVLKWGRVASLIALMIVAIPFAIREVRFGIYPGLASDVSDNSYIGYDDKEGGTGTLAKSSESLASKPMAPGDPMNIDGDLMNDGSLDRRQAEEKSTGGGAFARSGGKRDWSKQVQFNTSEYDPNSMVQTGPGVPSWRFRQVSLTFNGPVRHDQTMHLYLLSPEVTLTLAFLRVGLLALLVTAFLIHIFPRSGIPSFLRKMSPRLAVAATLLAYAAVTFGFEPSARAQIPSKDILEELKTRLLQPPACGDNCVEFQRLSLEVVDSRLRGRMLVGAAANAAVPLPGGLAQWSPDSVQMDGKEAAMRRLSDGQLLLDVPEGLHQVSFDGPMPDRETVQLPLPRKPKFVEVRVQGWSVDGLHEDGIADDTLQFTRSAKTVKAGTLQAGSLPPFVRVERLIHVGLNWQVETKIVRVSPSDTAIVLEVPLLDGESVTTADVRVVGNKAQVNMARNVQEIAWQSVLAEKSPIKLAAPKAVQWTEVWKLDVSPIWHAELTGLTVVHQQANGVLLPEWRPWPGESATIVISRPEGVLGQTLTIDSSTYSLVPGLRSTDVTLTLNVRSSRGVEHTITLPEGSDLQSVVVGSATLPLRLEARKLTIPLRPGAQLVTVHYREPRGIATTFSPSLVDLGTPTVNANVVIELGTDTRWLLFAYGPRLGPAVLFWSFFIVLAIVSFALSRISFVPIRAWQWALLGVGLSQTSPIAAAAVAGFFIVLGYRAAHPSAGATRFNLMQLFLAALAAVAVTILLVGVYNGLLGSPDMQVEGNGSSQGTLRWYQDRTGSQLPSVTAISVPMMAYRGVMLAWALWLAASLIAWAKWAWSAFSSGGLWKKFTPPPPRPAPPVAPQNPAAHNPTAHPGSRPVPADETPAVPPVQANAPVGLPDMSEDDLTRPGQYPPDDDSKK